MDLVGEFRRAIIHNPRIGAWRSWRNSPAHFNAGFLAFSSGNRVACKALGSQLPASQSRRVLLRQSATPAPFPGIGDSTAESRRWGGESFSYSELLLLLQPFSTRASVPPHPPSTTIVQSPQLQLISCDIIRSTMLRNSEGTAADISVAKLDWSILRISVAYLMQQDLSSVPKLNFFSSKWIWLRSVTGEICTFLPGTLSIPPAIDERVLCLTVRHVDRQFRFCSRDFHLLTQTSVEMCQSKIFLWNTLGSPMHNRSVKATRATRETFGQTFQNQFSQRE